MLKSSQDAVGVAKFGRADEVAHVTGRMMDFVNDDDVRLIVTFCDTAGDGFDPEEFKLILNELLDIPTENIMLVGIKTDRNDLEKFIRETIHVPRRFKVKREQLAFAESFADASRKFGKALRQVKERLKLADSFSHRIRKNCARSKMTNRVLLAIDEPLYCSEPHP